MSIFHDRTSLGRQCKDEKLVFAHVILEARNGAEGYVRMKRVSDRHIGRKEDEKRTLERPKGLAEREWSPLSILRASQSVHIVLQAVEKMCTSGHVYAPGLIVCSPTVSRHNTVGYRNVYTPCLQSTLGTSAQTSSGVVADYGDTRHASNPEARDIEHAAREG